MKYTKKLSDIKKDIENLFGIDDIGVKSRCREIVMYRNLYYVLARKYTFKSLTKIGKEINRDHTTVIYGLSQYDNLVNYHKNILYGQIILERKYIDEAFIKSEEDNIEVAYCDLQKNMILTKRQLELQTN